MEEIHKTVLKLLKEKRKEDPELRFSLRKTNRFGRLDKGYWFHGNDQYLAVSFWSGMDWKNKTPNIFVVIEEDGFTYLEVSVSDSEDKSAFIKKCFIDRMKREGISLNLHRWPHHIYIEFLGTDYLKSLDSFLNPISGSGIKDIIDDIIYNNDSFFKGSKPNDIIGFIEDNEFQKNLKRVEDYKEQNKRIKELSDRQNQVWIKSLKIQCVGDIRKENPLEMKIPQNTSWVFITGENGSGKSTILKAITAKLNEEAKNRYFPELNKDDIELELGKNVDQDTKRYEEYEGFKYKTHGFAAYGASRLMTTEEKNLDPEKTTDFYSIFEPDGILNDLDSYLDKIRYGSDGADTAADVIMILEEAFSDDELFPQIAKAELKSVHNLENSLYFEKDKEGNIYDKPVTFTQLSSGSRSLIALIGDLFSRLFAQLPFIGEPAELYGVVLIDEIDVHFHPAMQKRIVEILAANFPKVQFIVTTHSAVTLLGAPKNSAFYRVSRSKERGVEIEHLTEINTLELTPNLLLTSPIFGFSDLLNENLNNDFTNIRSEDSWSEVKVNDTKLKALLKKYEARKEGAGETDTDD